MLFARMLAGLWLGLQLQACAQGTIDKDEYRLRCPSGWTVRHNQALKVFAPGAFRDQTLHEWTFSGGLLGKPMPLRELIALSYQGAKPFELLGRKGFQGTVVAQLPQGPSWANHTYFLPAQDPKKHYEFSLFVKPASDLEAARGQLKSLLANLTLKK